VFFAPSFQKKEHGEANKKNLEVGGGEGRQIVMF